MKSAVSQKLFFSFEVSVKRTFFVSLKNGKEQKMFGINTKICLWFFSWPPHTVRHRFPDAHHGVPEHLGQAALGVHSEAHAGPDVPPHLRPEDVRLQIQAAVSVEGQLVRARSTDAQTQRTSGRTEGEDGDTRLVSGVSQTHGHTCRTGRSQDDPKEHKNTNKQPNNKNCDLKKTESEQKTVK